MSRRAGKRKSRAERRRSAVARAGTRAVLHIESTLTAAALKVPIEQFADDYGMSEGQAVATIARLKSGELTISLCLACRRPNLFASNLLRIQRVCGGCGARLP